jgi:hypothetical protein
MFCMCLLMYFQNITQDSTHLIVVIEHQIQKNYFHPFKAKINLNYSSRFSSYSAVHKPRLSHAACSENHTDHRCTLCVDNVDSGVL